MITKLNRAKWSSIFIMLFLSIIWLMLFSVVLAKDQTNLIDFGDENISRLAYKYQNLKNGKAKITKLNIIQFGDSHTASDTFTSDLRTLFRDDIGNGGIGWLTPMEVGGQIHQLVKINSLNWSLTNSRLQSSSEFPMGGFIATPTRAKAKIYIQSKEKDRSLYQATFLVKKGKGTLISIDAQGEQNELTPKQQERDGWGYIEADVFLPITITASTADAAKLGGIWLSKKDSAGVEVSPIGANGIRQTIWRKWHESWYQHLSRTKADMVVIAYGTNEAFDRGLNLQKMETDLIDGIHNIRNALPDAVIVLIGAPDVVDRSEKRTKCGEPLRYQDMKRIQSKVAKDEKILFWDWQKAMGGECQMKKWYQKKLVAGDYIHFTSSGYKASARLFYNDLTTFLNNIEYKKLTIERVNVAKKANENLDLPEKISTLIPKQFNNDESVALHIGSYRDYKIAQNQARLIVRMIQKGRLKIVKNNNVYQALIIGFTYEEAVTICENLKKRDIVCHIIRRD